METRDDIREQLSALVEEAGEYLAYLRELGVAGIEDSSSSLQPQTVMSTEQAAGRAEKVQPASTAPAVNPALRRNAQASVKIDAPQIASPQTRAPLAPPQANVAQSTPAQAPTTSAGHTDMAKRTPRRTPELEPPPPQETLFGEITPKDEASLPQANETLEDIWNDIGECTRCPLAAGRTHIVNSEGNCQARLMFVGEAPGADEDASARPFVGRAGQLLNKIIEAIGMKREDVMIGNVNRCRPPQNRTTIEEARTCKPFLLREIAVVRPDVIVVLGNTAMKNLLDTKEGITKLRGQFQDYKGIKVMPSFHPAYLLRDPSKKREAWEDMKKVRDYLDGKLKL